MKRNDLDNAFDPTPHVFTNRVDAVLHTLKEDEPVKKFTIRTAILALLYTMLFCSIACAIVLTQGQEWYYNNRFTAYQENEPAKQQEIFAHLETNVPQEPSEDSKGLVDVTIQDYAWVPNKNLLTISLNARAKDNNTYELHPMTAMDPDGYWTPIRDPNDAKCRTEHWLATKKGFGPPADVMDDPAKALLLADLGNHPILIGDSEIALHAWSFDSFTGNDGTVIAVMEINLKQLEDIPGDSNYKLQSTTSQEYISLRLGDSGDDVAKLQEALSEQGYYHGDINGLFGEGVRLAVMAFQAAHQLVSDGIAGPVTQSKLYGADKARVSGGVNDADDYLHLDDKGDAVVQLQDALTKLGYYTGSIDGIYSEDVRLAVMAFQKAHQLCSDGVAGPVTQFKLYSYEAKKATENGGTIMEAQATDASNKSLPEVNTANAAIEQYTDAEGMLSLRLPYQIIPFENGVYGTPTDGMAIFKMKIK